MVVHVNFILNVPTNSGTIQNAVFPNDTIVVMDPATGVTVKAVVGAIGAGAGTSTNITAYPFSIADFSAASGGFPVSAVGAGTLKVFVYGSIFAKGSAGPVNAAGAAGSYKSIQPQFTQYANQPIIIKDSFEINGSDMAQIGWVEVATEDGTSGYLWYLKSESETRLRFDDYLEMAMVEGELAAAGSGFVAQSANVPGFTVLVVLLLLMVLKVYFKLFKQEVTYYLDSLEVLVFLTLIKCLKT